MPKDYDFDQGVIEYALRAIEKDTGDDDPYFRLKAFVSNVSAAIREAVGDEAGDAIIDAGVADDREYR